MRGRTALSSRWPSDRTQKTGLFTDIRCKYLSWFWITIYIHTHTYGLAMLWALPYYIWVIIVHAECHYRIFSALTNALACQTKFYSPLSVAQWVGKLLCCAADLYKCWRKGVPAAAVITPRVLRCDECCGLGQKKHFSTTKRYQMRFGGEKHDCCRFDALYLNKHTNFVNAHHPLGKMFLLSISSQSTK